MDSTEKPSPQRLQKLRWEGIVPLSTVANSFLVLASVSGVISILRFRWSELFTVWREMVIAGHEEPNASLAKLALVGEGVTALLVLPVAVGAGGVLLVGLAVSRFTLLPGRLVPSLSRLMVRGQGHSPLGVLSSLLWIAGTLVVVGAASSTVVFVALGLLNRDVQALGQLFAVMRSGILSLGVPFLAAGAAVALAISYFGFLHRHKMTRAELEAELREEA